MKKLALSLALLFSFEIPAMGQEEDEFDFFIARPTTGNQTVVAGIDVGNGNIFFPGVRVIGAEFEGAGGFDPGFLAEEPGFNNPGSAGIDVNGDPFVQPPGAVVPNQGDLIALQRLNVEVGGLSGAELFFWDGVGEVNFVETVDTVLAIADPDDAADITGAFDDHPILSLTTASDPGVTPAEGIYLFSVTASLPGLDPTDPLFIALGTPSVSEASIEAAVGFVNTALAIPEPMNLMLITLGTLLGLGRRRV